METRDTLAERVRLDYGKVVVCVRELWCVGEKDTKCRRHNEKVKVKV